MSSDDLYTEALEAINEMYAGEGDRITILENLQGLKDEIEIMVESLQ